MAETAAIPKPEAAKVQPAHLAALCIVIYGAAVTLLLGPVASTAGWIGSLAAAAGGVLLARRLAVGPVRGPWLGGGVLLVMALGFWADWVVGHLGFVVRMLGLARSLMVVDILTLGLMVLGITIGLRLLSMRVSFMAAVETAVLAGGVILYFAIHRDLNIAHPRGVADWSTSRGYNPQVTITIIGVVCVGALLLLMLQTRRMVNSTIALVLLSIFLGVAYAIAEKYIKREEPPRAVPAHGVGTKGKNPIPDPTQLEAAPQDQQRPKKKLVAIVTFHNDYTPQGGIYHFHEGAVSELKDNLLVANSLDNDGMNAFSEKPADIPSDRAEFGESTSVRTTISLLERHERPFGLAAWTRYEPRPNAQPDTFILTYSASSQTVPDDPDDLIGRSAGRVDWTPETSKHYTTYPNNPRYAALARKILADNADYKALPAVVKSSPYVRAWVLQMWMAKNIVYSLKASYEGTDPIIEFLEDGKRGRCSHIAYGLIYMLRSQGIPARMALGYAAGAARRQNGSSLALVTTDRHAWCEIYLRGVGWVPIDPALERSEEPAFDEPDPVTQRQLGEMNRPDRQPDTPPAPWGRYAMLASLWMLGLTAASLYGGKTWRRLRPYMAGEGIIHRVCYRAALDRLAELGLRRNFGETREAFARRVKQQVPEFARLTAAHLRRTLGPRSRLTRQQCLGLVRRLGTRTSRVFPRFKRVLAILNPVAWLGVW